MRLKKKVEELEKELRTYKFKLDQVYNLIIKLKWYTYKKNGYNYQTENGIWVKKKSKMKGEIIKMINFKEIQEKLNKMQDKINIIENDIFEVLIKNNAQPIDSIIAMQRLIREIKEEIQQERKLKGDNNQWN